VQWDCTKQPDLHALSPAINSSAYRTVFIYLLQEYLLDGLLRFVIILEFRPRRLENLGHLMILFIRTDA